MADGCLQAKLEKISLLSISPENNVQFLTFWKSSTLLHINPASKLFGSRGLTPKYKLGLYGPHIKLWLDAREISLTRIHCPSPVSSAVVLLVKREQTARREKTYLAIAEMAGTISETNESQFSREERIVGSMVAVCKRHVRQTFKTRLSLGRAHDDKCFFPFLSRCYWRSCFV